MEEMGFIEIFAGLVAGTIPILFIARNARAGLIKTILRAKTLVIHQETQGTQAQPTQVHGTQGTQSSRRIQTPSQKPSPAGRHSARGAKKPPVRTKTRIVKTRRTRTRPAHIESQPVAPINETPPIPPVAIVRFSACPACGLEAPEALMAEHFTGSPSHQDGHVEVKMDTTEKPPLAAHVSSEEEARDALRSILQMLVPPRAFGHRHAQRALHPFDELMDSIEGTQGSLTLN
jgi:hypothetical protein